jgi:hypothetical protein
VLSTHLNPTFLVFVPSLVSLSIDSHRPLVRLPPMSKERREVQNLPTEADSDGEEDASGIAQRTERLADQVIDKFRSDSHIPDVQAKAERVRDTLRSVESFALRTVLAALAAAALSGMASVLLSGVVDWYMHLAMYLLTATVVVMYVRAHQLKRRLARWINGLVAIGLLSFYVWVLGDLAGPRLEAHGAEPVLRRGMPELYLTGTFLALSATALLVHLLVRRSDVGNDGPI